MSTYRQLIYMVSDLVKELSSDSQINEEHIRFLLDRYRSYLLKQKYLKKAQEIPLSNYQTVCSELQEVPMVPGCKAEDCLKDDKFYMRSVDKVTMPLTFSDTSATIVKCSTIYTLGLYKYNVVGYWSQSDINYVNNLLGITLPDPASVPEGNYFILNDYYGTTCREDAQDMKTLIKAHTSQESEVVEQEDTKQCDELNAAMARGYSNVNVISRNAFPYAGENKYTKRFSYGTIEPDSYFYVKSASERVKEFNRVFITAIFEDPIEAYSKSVCSPCTKDNNDCDEWDYTFPIEDALQTQLLALVIRDCLGAAYRPSDTVNNGRDDLSSLEQFVRNNMKNRYVKQSENNE